ncbi:MAG: hypothetical protein AABW92_05075 [Nanoarchaeota archaeon]
MSTIDYAFDNIVVRNQENIEVTPEELAKMTGVQFGQSQYKILLRTNALWSPPARKNEERPLLYEIKRGFIALTEGPIVTRLDAYQTAEKLIQAVYDFQVRKLAP